MNSKGRGLAVIFWVVVLTVCMVSTALAEGGKNQKKKSVTFTAAGMVTEIEPGSGQSLPTMTLAIDKANRLLKKQISEDPFIFIISEQVKIKPGGTEPHVFDLTLDDLAVDDYVRVLGRKQADGTFLVNHIVVHIEE